MVLEQCKIFCYHISLTYVTENLVRELVFYFHVKCLKGVNVK